MRLSDEQAGIWLVCFLMRACPTSCITLSIYNQIWFMHPAISSVYKRARGRLMESTRVLRQSYLQGCSTSCQTLSRGKLRWRTRRRTANALLHNASIYIFLISEPFWHILLIASASFQRFCAQVEIYFVIWIRFPNSAWHHADVSSNDDCVPGRSRV